MRKLSFLPITIACLLFAGCASQETIETPKPLGYQDVSEFKAEKDSSYALYTPEKGFIDISSYVNDVKDGTIYVKSSILTDEMGFEKMNRDSGQDEVEMMEFVDGDTNLLQFQVDGLGIVYNGTVLETAENMTKDGEDLIIPLNDLLFSMGYIKVNQSLISDTLVSLAYRGFDDPSVEIPIDESGNIIYGSFVATPSDASRPISENIDLTSSETSIDESNPSLDPFESVAADVAAEEAASSAETIAENIEETSPAVMEE